MQTVKVSQGGRVVIPADLREKLNFNQGDELIIEARNGELVLASKRQRILQAREKFRQMLPAIESGRSIVDEFLAERRAEVENDNTEMNKRLKKKESSHEKTTKRA